MSYIEALEQWAIGTLGRAPSLGRVRDELPKALRPDPLGKRNEIRAAPPATADTSAAEASTGLAAGPAAGAPSTAPPRSPLVGRGSFGTAARRRAGTAVAARTGSEGALAI